MLFNLRFSPVTTPDHIKARVHAALDRHGVDYELVWNLSGLPFMTPKGRLVDLLSHTIAAQTGITPALSTSGGTSDGRFIAAVAREVVEFGPLAEGMHGIDERVNLSHLAPLSTIYEQTVTALLGETNPR